MNSTEFCDMVEAKFPILKRLEFLDRMNVTSRMLFISGSVISAYWIGRLIIWIITWN